VPVRKPKKLRLRIGPPFPGPTPKSQLKDKHVESTLAACLDEGSNPSSSTKKPPSNLVDGGFLFVQMIGRYPT
jgi:hypothetical protein